MSIRQARPARSGHRVLDGLFLAGCVGAYLVLLGAVAAALKAYVL